MKDPRVGPLWMDHGGGATLLSYGVTPPRHTDVDGWTRASEALAAAAPPEHVAFLADTPLYTWLGDYVFAHAGVRPNIDPEKQTPDDLMTIRADFLKARAPLPGRMVVFGHTPFDHPFIESHKIGIDTGACVTGVLTTLAIKDGRRRFLQTGVQDSVWDTPEPSEDKPHRL